MTFLFIYCNIVFFFILLTLVLLLLSQMENTSMFWFKNSNMYKHQTTQPTLGLKNQVDDLLDISDISGF